MNTSKMQNTPSSKRQNTPFQDMSSPAPETNAPEKESRPSILQSPTAPEPEVLERPFRRRFSAAYKLQILREVDAAVGPGEVGAILRREGLYYSNIYKWRQQLERAETEHLAPKKRGRKPKRTDLDGKRLKELERENRRLQKQLDRAHLLLDIQKKISEIAGIPLKPVNLDDYDL